MSGQSRNPRIGALSGLALGLALGAAAGSVATARGADAAVGGLPLWSLPPPASARVLIVEDPQATSAFVPRVEVIRQMVDRGLTNLTGKPQLRDAWRSLLSTQDTVGIKVFSAPGALSGTRPAVAEAVVSSLLDAGHPASRIILWDRQMIHLRKAGFTALGERLGIRVAASMAAGYDTNHFYESSILGHLVHGDYDFDQRGEQMGRNSYVSKLVTEQMTRIINLPPLLNHNLTSVSGNLASLALGSVDNTIRFSHDPARLAVAVPDIYALPVLGDRVALNIVDALIAQYSGEETTLLHYSAVLNQLWFSTDPVALDVLAIQELEKQRAAGGLAPVKANLELYQNATLLEIGVSDLKSILVETVK